MAGIEGCDVAHVPATSQTVELLAEFAGNEAEDLAQVLADELHRGDDHDGDERGDQAVFDGGDAVFITDETLQVLGQTLHGGLLGLKSTLATTDRNFEQTTVISEREEAAGRRRADRAAMKWPTASADACAVRATRLQPSLGGGVDAPCRVLGVACANHATVGHAAAAASGGNATHSPMHSHELTDSWHGVAPRIFVFLPAANSLLAVAAYRE